MSPTERWRRVGAAALAATALALGSRAAAQPAWEPLATGTTADLHALHFVTATVGYAAGAAGTVLRTADGGATWADVSPGGGDLRGVHFFDPAVGVVVGAGGAALRTTDGGTTWAPVASGTSETLYAVAFAGDVGLVGAGSQTILRSSDRGATWAVVQDGFFGGGFYGAHLLDAARGIVAGQNSIFQPLVGVTADGGATFDFSAFYLDANEGRLTGVRLLDAATAVAVGVTFDGQGAVARSADGGQTWTTALFPGAPLLGVTFAGQTGTAVGEGGTVLRTADGGQTWAPEPSGSSAALYAVAAPGPSVAFAAGSGGTVLRRTTSTAAPPGPPAASELALEPPRPNPFAGRTTLRFSLAGGGHVRLRVYDALGREVAVLADGHREAGPHEVTFDAAALSAGAYRCVLDAAGGRASRPLLVRR